MLNPMTYALIKRGNYDQRHMKVEANDTETQVISTNPGAPHIVW